MLLIVFSGTKGGTQFGEGICVKNAKLVIGEYRKLPRVVGPRERLRPYDHSIAKIEWRKILDFGFSPDGPM